MSAKRRRKPHDPAQAEARRLALRRTEDAAMRAEGIDPGIARWGDDALSPDRVEALERQGFSVVRAETKEAKDAGVSTVAVDHRGRQIKASHKADVWQQLFTRGALNRDQLNAVRNLQDLMAKRAGVGGRDEEKATTQIRVDDTRDACLTTDAMLMAGLEMDLTLQLVGPPSQRLLTGLLWPAVMGEAATMQKPMRRCAATVERQLAAPKNGARPGAWQQAVREFEGKGEGRTRFKRRVCEALNAPEERKCAACGEALPVDIVKDGVIVSRPGIEQITVEADWRDTVQRLAPWAKNPMAQSALLVNAAQALLDVRPQVVKAMKERAEQKSRARRAADERADPQGLALA